MKTRILIALFWWFALLFTLAVWVSIFALLGAAYGLAHTATPTAAMPQGWQYSAMCCSSTDCGEIRAERVKETPDGYVVTLRPEDHIMIAKETTFQIPYSSTKIKDSPDGVFHICVSRQQVMDDGATVHGGTLYCFYVPPKGF
jgi:hypothetical protein